MNATLVTVTQSNNTTPDGVENKKLVYSQTGDLRRSRTLIFILICPQANFASYLGILQVFPHWLCAECPMI